MIDFKAVNIITDALIKAGYQIGDGGFDMINNVKDQDWYDADGNCVFTIETKFHKQDMVEYAVLPEEEEQSKTDSIDKIIELCKQAIATS